jgi:hypothetical protein
MPAYTLGEGDPVQRKTVRCWLHGGDRVASQTQEAIEAFPYSASAPFYGPSKHVNDDTRVGIDLAHRASADWGVTLDDEVFVPILTLHNVGKPLPFHGSNFEAMVLHYADYFATDYVSCETTSRPFYQRHWH